MIVDNSQCPFCGCDKTPITPVDPNEAACFVRCDECGAEGPLGKNAQQAQTAWDTRNGSVRLRQELEYELERSAYFAKENAFLRRVARYGSMHTIECWRHECEYFLQCICPMSDADSAMERGMPIPVEVLDAPLLTDEEMEAREAR